MPGSTDETDDSLVDRVRRAVSGPTAEERAGRLDERARESPASLETTDAETLRELLDNDDPEVVGTALGAAEALAEERPALVARAAPELVACLTNRPAEEWRSTTLREADRSFMNDLLAGSTLFELATADPDHLAAVTDDMETLLCDTEGRLEPHTLFALARVAADGGDVTVPTTALVDPIARTLRTSVENEAEDDDTYGLRITVATRGEQVTLLRGLGHPDALETLRYAEANTADEDLATAAADAIDAIES